MFWCYNIVALTVKFVYAQILPLFSAITIIVKQEYGAVYLRHHGLLKGPFQDRPFSKVCDTGLFVFLNPVSKIFVTKRSSVEN
jgi:hypothetical protein